MLRGVVPDSFPCQPTALPVRARGQRRFVVMDDNVHRIYGARVEQVCLQALIASLLNVFINGHHTRSALHACWDVNVLPHFPPLLPEQFMQLTAGLCAQYFAAHGVECAILALPTNEANKGFELVFEIARHLEEFKLNRYGGHSILLASFYQVSCLSLQCSM